MAVQVDYLGPEGAFNFLEDSANYPKYIAAAKRRDDLRLHLERSELPPPEKLTDLHLNMMRETAHIHFNIMQLVGTGHYSGESQHHEGSNIVYSAITGKLVYAEPETSVRYFG